MAGIYIHIPFCRQACHYCDFHFSTSVKNRGKIIESIMIEMGLRKNEFRNLTINSIYFGGGTPSILEKAELIKLLESIYDQYDVSTDSEITLEANPDDLDELTLKNLLSVGINRLSVGTQTFDDRALKYLNRTHSSSKAIQVLELARKLGFTNISADLIFAIPGENSLIRLENDLKKLIDYRPEHISLYGLTIEEDTVFGNWHKKGIFHEVSEEENNRQYDMAVEKLISVDYEHYEVSNFCRLGMESRHNSSYWKSEPYLGLGPSAHSFSGNDRRINVRDNHRYTVLLRNGELPYEKEILTPTKQFNEYILTRSRTKWGLDFAFISEYWGVDMRKKHKPFIDMLIHSKKAEMNGAYFRLTSKGFNIADEVAMRFFMVE